MDFRLIKSGMRIKLKDTGQLGTVKYVYNDNGYKTFDILFDDEERLNTQWTIRDKKRLSFNIEEYKQDFDKLIKGRKV